MATTTTYVTLGPVTYLEDGRVRHITKAGVLIQLTQVQASALAGSISYVRSGWQVEDLPRTVTLRYASLSEFPINGDINHLYLAANTGLLYSWDEASRDYETVSQDDITSNSIGDATLTGRALLTAGDQAAARTAIDSPSQAERLTSELCSRMTVRPNRTRRTQVSSLIASLMSSGVWDKLDGLYLFAAHDVQAAKLNWAGCAQDVTAVNAPTFQIDRGFTGNGTSAYLDTNTAASLLERYKANDATMGVYSRTNTAGSNIIEISAGTKAYLNPAAAGAVAVRANSSAGSIINPSNGGVNTGLFAWSRDSTTAYVYRAGALLGSAAVAAGAVDAVNVTFSQYNSTNYSTRQLAAGFFGQRLSGTEHAVLHAALLTYLTAVGANV